MNVHKSKKRRQYIQISLTLTNANYLTQPFKSDNFCGCNRCGHHIWIDLSTIKLTQKNKAKIRLASRPLNSL